jgi:hypothetical protein
MLLYGFNHTDNDVSKFFHPRMFGAHSPNIQQQRIKGKERVVQNIPTLITKYNSTAW